MDFYDQIRCYSVPLKGNCAGYTHCDIYSDK